MLTISPPDAASEPMLTATGFLLASALRALYSSCEAAAPPPGESTRSSTPATEGSRSTLRIHSSVGSGSMMGPETETRAMRWPPISPLPPITAPSTPTPASNNYDKPPKNNGMPLAEGTTQQFLPHICGHLRQRAGARLRRGNGCRGDRLGDGGRLRGDIADAGHGQGRLAI